MAKIGYVLGLIGSIIMLASNIILFFITMVINMISGLIASASVDLTVFEILPITQLTTIALAILGIVFSKKAK
ncbi:MAG: hypothetical protein ACFE9R_06995, partial [Candidatus Hermodarchaeota archaeon]